MKKNLYIMSRCVSKTQEYSKFRLNGSYLGQKVKYVFIRNLSFDIGKEYIAEVSNIEFKENNLLAKCVKYKEIIHLR